MPTGTTETARVPEDISGWQRRMPVGGITWRHTFRALRHRNYRLFFWGQLVSLIGTWMQQTAMSWFVYQITNSKLLLGTVAAVGSAPMMLFSIWGGSLADLYPKRSIIVMTQTAQMICAFLLAAGAWAGFATPLFIIIIAALNGVAMGFDMLARQAFTVEMASREDLLNASSLNSSIVNGSRSARRGDVRTFIHTAKTRARRRLVVLDCVVRVFAEPKFLSRTCMSPHCRVWHAPVFLP